MNKPRSLRRQTFAHRVLSSTFSRWGARFGLLWIAILATMAVFAPWLANSRPLLVSVSGVISSPVLESLTVADVSWMAGFLTLLLSLMFPIGWLKRVVIIAAVSLIVFILAHGMLQKEQVTVHESFREDESAGVFEWSVYPPIPYSPRDYIRDGGDTGFLAPSTAHWFGTEENGADVLSRMIHAARVALGIGLVATGIAMFIGVIVGGLMGYFSGVVDMVGMRLVEIFEAIPTLFLLLTFVAFFGRNLYIMMVIIGLTSWTGYARYLRAEFLKLRKQDYVQAAIASGIPLPSILFRHMLPNGIAPVLVAASFGFASAILAEATLSFLGLGLVDAPSWGQMLNQAVRSSSFNWWMAVFPGGAIFLTVFAYNLIGDALRDAIDPQLAVSRS